MDPEEKKPPKVFISYSWSSEEHVQWIISIAERLVNDGIDVILDKWNLKEGNDRYVFMEQMVTDPTASKVLIFSDKKYKEKADTRTKGVGTEAQIISKKIYDKVTQDKFIPIILQFNEKGEAYLPVFLASRFAIDFSTPQNVNDNWEKLLRIIFNRPAYRKPKIGTPPSYLFEKETNYISNRGLLEEFKRAVFQDKGNYLILAKSYVEKFIESLESYRMSQKKDIPEDEILLSSINDMLPCRNELCDFFDMAIMKNETSLFELIIEFLEELLKYRFPPKNGYPDHFCENYRFFSHEIFIYLISFLIKNKCYSRVNDFLEHEYYIPASLSRGDSTLTTYNNIFYGHSTILTRENEQKNPKRLSPLADLFSNRATLKKISFEDFMQTDFILFLKGLLDRNYMWSPESLVYAPRFRTFELFSRAKSDKNFEILKTLFRVSSRTELKGKIDEAYKNDSRQQLNHIEYYYHIDPRDLMNYNEITKEN